MATPVEAAKGKALADVRAQLRETEITIMRSVEEAGGLKADMDHLRAIAAQLTQQYSAIEKALRDAEERSATAAHTVIDLEKSRGSLAAETTRQLEQVTRVRDTVSRELARFDREVRTRLESARSDIEALIVQNQRSGRRPTHATERVRIERHTDARADHAFAVQMRAGMKRFVDWKDCWISLRLALASASMMTQKTRGFITYRRAVVGALALTGLVVTRPSENADRAGASEKSVVAAVLTASAPTQPDPKSASVLPTMQAATTATVQFSVNPRLLKAPVQPPKPIRTLAVGSDPAGAAVFINRQRVGDTPVQLRRGRVLPGPKLASTLPTMRAAATATARFPVNPRPLKAPVRPTEFIGTLLVESNPAGAAVFVNRQRVGETPVQLPRVRAGSHVVWIERQGYQRWTAAVLVPSDKLTRVSTRLRPEPGR